MPTQTDSALSRPRRDLAISLLLFGLTFIWSVTGSIALRNVLLLCLLALIPFGRIDTRELKYCMTRPAVIMLMALSCWIALHNQYLAWDSSHAWDESTQWFKSMIWLGIGICLALSVASALRRIWAWPIAMAWALHLILNVALKDWSAQTFVSALQASTMIGSRDMVSYLGTGLLAFLLADVVGRSASHENFFPLSMRWLWVCVFSTLLLTTATMTRNSIPVMAAELGIAGAAQIGVSGTHRQRVFRSALAVVVVILLSGAAIANFKMDTRWNNFSDSARIGWDIEHNNWWIDQVANPQPANAEGKLVDHSAYNRVAWIKGAALLIANYPLGTGYDRNAFRRALIRHYGAAITASGHAHAGLFDFTLATGLPGGLMLIAALLLLIAHGWRSWRTTHRAAALALVIFVVSYLLRATVDGIVRDHMLTQAMFVIGLLLASSAPALAHRQAKA